MNPAISTSADLARAAAIRSHGPASGGASRNAGAPEPQPPALPAPSQALDGAELEAARQAANRALAEKGRELVFEFDDDSNRIVSRLVDKTTGEVIRQVPSETLLAIARALAAGASSGAVLRTFT
jgi:flagellar protein FlaG